jgi:uracil-DNA glycosylase
MESDLRIPRPDHGYLEPWAEQGVLLLNSVLTVRSGEAASHRGKGWEQFTDAVVGLIAEKTEPVVFLLWGSYAQKKAAFVRDIQQGGLHLVLKAPHPSPLSAHNGFFGCRHFSQTNAFLESKGMAPINWTLPDPAT